MTGPFFFAMIIRQKGMTIKCCATRREKEANLGGSMDKEKA